MRSTQRQVDELRRPALKPGPDLPWFCLTAVTYTAGSPGWTITTLGESSGSTDTYVVDQESVITSGFITAGTSGEGSPFIQVWINGALVIRIQGDPGETIYTPSIPVHVGDVILFIAGSTSAEGGIKLTGIHENVTVTWVGP